MTLAAGTKLGLYEIRSQLGAGGMGEVYRARDTKLGRDVAIKVLPAAFSADAERLRRFELEAQATGALNHPNILVIFHIGTHEGAPYIVSELLEGETLRERMAGAALPQRKAIDYSLQIAHGLAAAHAKGIVHRDLKPDNLFVTNDGRVKILDFGLAKLTGTSDGNQAQTDIPTRRVDTDPGLVVGTMGYMSPEQLRGKLADHRSDIFSFGAILYEMLSGKRAFRGDSTAETMSAILREDPPDLSETNKTVSPALERVVRHCLEKNPEERFHSASDLAFAIEALSGSSSASSQTITPITALPERSKIIRHLMWIGAAAVTAATLAVFVTLRWQPARSELPLRQFKLDIHNFRQGFGAHAKLSPDGSNLAYVSDGKLWVQSLDGIKPHEIDSSITQNGGNLIWSPDSRSLAYSNSGQLYRVPATGGPHTQICKLPDIIDGAWSSDELIVFSRWRGDLYQVSAQGGEPKPLGILNPEIEVDFHSVIFLPGNNVLMFAVHPKTGPSRTEILVGGKRRVILDGARCLEITNQTPCGQFLSYSETGHLLILRQGATWAVSFSVSELKVTGEAFKVLDGVALGTGADGTLLYTRGGEASRNQIVWVSRSGEIQQKIGEPLAGINSVALSPDGNRLAVASKSGDSFDIWMHDLVRNVRTLMAGGEKDEIRPVWSPDGKHIYYDIVEGMGATLYVKSADGTGEARELGLGMTPSVSKSGEMLAYAVPGQDGLVEIWYQRMKPDAATPVQGAPASRYLSLREAMARIWLSPDGKFAAYRSTVSGNAEIYLSLFPSGEGRWQVSVGGVTVMAWSSSGNELFYVDAQRTLFSVPVSTQPALLLGKPQRLFSLQEKGLQALGLAVTSDGQRFVMVQGLGDEASSEALYLLQGWPTLLKQAQTK
jgi:eukaryotic-like serine/threonine-protein kinase